MAEYIEREAVLGALDCVFFKTDPDGAEQIGVLSCRRAIREFPAADVAPVVRCRDCKHFSRFQNTNWCEVFNDGYYSPDDNDFCSRGTKDGE